MRETGRESERERESELKGRKRIEAGTGRLSEDTAAQMACMLTNVLGDSVCHIEILLKLYKFAVAHTNVYNVKQVFTQI